MQLKSALPLLVLLTVVILTSAPIVAAHPVDSGLSLGVASGPPSVASSCFDRGIMQTTLTCALGSVEAGQIILVEVSDVPQPSVTDTMGDHFALQGEAPLPGSTYVLQVYSATTSLSGSVTVNIAGVGGFPAVIGHVIAGAIGVEGVSTGSGFSATPEVTAFQPSPGTLLIAAAFLQSSLGVLTTSLSAGPGYTLLTGGQANVDEYAVASGTQTTSPFILGSPLGWAEIEVTLIPASSSSPIPEFGAPTILVAAMGLALLALVKKAKILKI